MDTIRDSILTQCDLSGLTEKDSTALHRLFELNGADYDGFLLLSSDEIMNVDELLIVRVRDEEQFNRLEEAVSARLDRQKQNFRGYGTDQEDRLEQALTLEQGDYYFYAVSPQADSWEELFLSLIR